MKLELKQLNIKRFKGLVNQSFTFDTQEAWIFGKNGSGKTSLFDSFTWCLFGKDHLGRSDHEIKSYDKAGKIIPRTDVEVEVIIFVDGANRKLRRCYQEVWVKPKTEIEEVSKGHTTEYFIDDVKVSKSRYDNLVSTLCDDIVFKTITNPLYFTSLKADEQRKLLFSMVNLTDEEIAEGNAEFKSLLLELTGKSLEDFKKSISNQKARIKPELIGLPERIAGLKEGMPEMPDEEKITLEISQKQARVDEIDQILNDSAKKAENQNHKRMEVQQQINALELNQQEIVFQHTTKLNEERSAIRTRITEIEQTVKNFQSQIKQNQEKRVALVDERGKANQRLEQLRAQWKTIKADEIHFPEGAFKCPTCDRLLEVADIEAKQMELTAKFNQEKARRLEENKTAGLSVVARIKEIDQELEQIAETNQPAAFSGTKIDALNASLDAIEKRIGEYVKDTHYIQNAKDIEQLKQKLSTIDIAEDNSSLIEEKKTLTMELDQLKSKTALKSVVANTNERIKQLEERIRVLNQEMANLEKKEYLVKQFEFTKNSEYEARINSMFRFVKFRLFKTQVDGQVVPIFECMVNGVPFSTLNNAMQIGAGLDIIDAISAKRNMYAPIWIDNRESITEIPHMETQIINLVVDAKYSSLTMKQSSAYELQTA
jgi:exonuclease SbcC